jgi:hypothetical protein
LDAADASFRVAARGSWRAAAASERAGAPVAMRAAGGARAREASRSRTRFAAPTGALSEPRTSVAEKGPPRVNPSAPMLESDVLSGLVRPAERLGPSTVAESP